MKTPIRTLLLIFLLFTSFPIFAANRFWVGSIILTNWNNILNWSSTSGGLGGSSVPGSGDAVIFDNGSVQNCNIDAAVNIGSLTVTAAYTGTIAQGSNTISVSGIVSLGGGSFSGGSANITLTGAFTNSGTAFTSTTAIFELRDNAAFTGGSFSHNNGTVRFNCTNNAAQAITGTAPTFYTLEFVGIGRTYTLSALTGDVTVINALNLSGTLFYNLAGGIIDVHGDINSTNSATGCGGDALININGTVAQNFNGGATAGIGAVPQLTINKSSGTLTLVNFPAVSNSFTYTAGTITVGSSTFCFTHGNTGAYSISGNLTFNNVEFTVNTSLLTIGIAAATTLTVPGSLILAGAGNLVLNTGNINLNGNLVLTNTGSGGGGTTSINLVGTGAQTIDGTAVVVNQCRLPALNINKSSGTLTLAGNISFAGNVTYTAGAIAAGSSTCYVVATLAISGSFSVNNLTLQGTGNITLTVASGSTVTAANILDLESGANSITINTGTLAVQGNLVDNNTSTSGGGTGTILLNGTAAQAISSTGFIDQGKLPGVTINNTGGTITFPSLITVVGNWTYVSGTLDAITNNNTVVLENTLTVTGSHTLNNVTFNGTNNFTFSTAAGTTLTISGTMALNGTGNVIFNGGNINLNGNLSLTNTGTGGGTTALSFTSAVNQAILSTLAANQSTLPSVVINKTGGTLTFPAILTVKGSWTYLGGTLDVATNNSTVIFGSPLGTGVFGITGSHTLNNVTFQGNNNNTATVNTGTILTVTGLLSFTGTANMFVNTTITGATAIQAQGDITVSNTSVSGGGTGVILVNGTGAQQFTGSSPASQGLMPNITIQKSSGTLTLSGIISESRNWNYISGTVDAATNTSTVVFGGNSLTIAGAGMSFYNATFASNTTTLSNALTVANTLSINGTAVLVPAANGVNLGGNWVDWGTGGFTEGTGTVDMNGSALQTVTCPGGENFTNLIIDNTGAGVQLVNPATVATALTMSQGNISLNGNMLTLGLSTVSPGTLLYTNGTMIGTGSFLRWFKALAITGNVGLFPMGTATDYRPFFVSSTTAPVTGGTMAVAYTDAGTNTVVSFADGASTVQVRKDLNWGVTTANGLAGGLYNLSVDGTGFGTIGLISDLRLTLVGGVTGTAGVNAGTTANPQVNRTGLSLASLANNFYVASVNPISSPLPVGLLFFRAVPANGSVDLSWSTVTETNDDHFSIQRSQTGTAWEDVGQIAGAGTTGGVHVYSFTDPSPYPGNSYYRLVQLDWNGTQTYSGIDEVNIIPATSALMVYPNPVAENLFIHSALSDMLSVELFNSNGERITVPSEGGAGITILHIKGLPAGVYYIRVARKKGVETQKIIIWR